MTMNTGGLKVTTPNDREIVMTRAFDAPRRLVWDAWTRPELVKRWLGVQNGWTLDVCEIDLRVGGAYRYVWRGPAREEMGMVGVYREIVAPSRLVSTEKFDDPWYSGEAEGTVELVEQGGRTTVIMTIRYESKEIRDGVLKSPMAGGVERSYQKLDEMLSSGAMQGA
jgi:uncharacterized protein YndB with AHSA1/START domain